MRGQILRASDDHLDVLSRRPILAPHAVASAIGDAQVQRVVPLWFNVTRPMSIAAAAVLTFMYPLLLILILVGAGIALWVGYFRK